MGITLPLSGRNHLLDPQKFLRQEAPRLITVFDKTVPLHSSTPNQPYIIDEIVELREYGIWAHQDFCYLDVSIEAPDGASWRVTGNSRWTNDNWVNLEVPAGLPDGYEGQVTAIVGDYETAPAGLDEAVWAISLSSGAARGNDVYWFDTDDPGGLSKDRYQTWLRVLARFDCSSGLHDAKNYRLRYRVRVPDLTVWKFVLDIPPTDNTRMMVEPMEIDFAALGVSGYAGSLMVTATIKRNGRTIRQARGLDAGTTVALDPPSSPVAIALYPSVEGAEWWEQGNGNNLFQGTTQPGDALRGGCRVGNPLGACSEWMNTRGFLFVETRDDDVSTYEPTPGATPIASPAGHREGCTLTLRLLHVADHFAGIPPFRSGSDPAEIYLGAVPTILLPNFTGV